MNKHFPAEWTKQQATLLTWPDEHTDWASQLVHVEPCYQDLVAAISQYQAVWIICRNAQARQHIEQCLKTIRLGPFPIKFLHCAFNDTWVRDYGPISITKDGTITWLNFQFNGWGGKYASQADNQVTANIKPASIALETSPLVLEGGAIETDGIGTLLTTDCLFSATRNAQYSPAQIIEQLKGLLGVTRVITIENAALLNDDTDGHIDTLVRFCNPHTLAYCASDDPQNPNFTRLKTLEAQLKTLRTVEGAPYQLIPLLMPNITDKQGQPLPASYANFMLINNAVLMPTFQTTQDAPACAQLARAFPARNIIPIDSLALVQQSGALHCASMQIVA